ncbi:MAG: MATE family efflux transporter [Candidatus Muiribacteriota bacterium]
MEKITQMNISKAVLRIAFPAILSHLFIVAYEIVDLFWLDKLEYPEVFASLGAASFITWSLYSIMHVITAGVNSYVARYSGAQDKKGYLTVTWEGLIMASCLSILITSIMHVTHMPLFSAIGLEGIILKDAGAYFSVVNLGFIFLFLYTLITIILNAHGFAKFAMYLQFTMLLANGIFDPLFILGWGPFGQMGIAGAAWATILARVLGIILGFALLVKLNLFEFNFYKYALKFYHFTKILKVGAPVAFIHWIFAMVYPVLTVFITRLGNVDALGALNVCHKIEGVAYFVAIGFAVSASTLSGQHYGAKNYSKIWKSVNITQIYTSIFLGITSILFVFFPQQLLRLIVSSPEVIQEGAVYLRIIGYFEIFMGWEIVYEGGFTGLGKTYYPMIISIPLTLSRIVFGYFLAFKLNMGVVGLWWAISISTLLKGLCIGAAFFYKTYKFRFDINPDRV